MALEIITAIYGNANVTISRGELKTTCHCIYPIHIWSYHIGIIMENKPLEIITGGVCTANVTISSDNLWTKCVSVRPLDVI